MGGENLEILLDQPGIIDEAAERDRMREARLAHERQNEQEQLYMRGARDLALGRRDTPEALAYVAFCSSQQAS